MKNSKISNKPELLAPAGDFDCLKAAVNSGADAVYVGSTAYSARASAKNFNDDELNKAVDYCHLFGSKLYLTLNTLLFDRELKRIVPFIKFINEIGVDCVIVQDLGLAKLIKKIAPDLPLHASTQMTIHNVDGANLLNKLGFKRVVLARELSKEQIEAICNHSSVETEIFIHGALCVCYSGQCLMSSFIGGRSGNRGRCAQPCRLAYSTANLQNKTILSPKDYNLLEYIPFIKKMNVTSLKIEGRMKGPSYVEVVTSIYRKYLDTDIIPTQEDVQFLQSAFDRGGYTAGYFEDKTGKDMFCFQKPENPFLKQRDLIVSPKKEIVIKIKYEIHLSNPIILTTVDEDGNEVSQISDFMVERAEKNPTEEERIRQQLSKTGDTVYHCEEIKGECDEGIFIPVNKINALRRDLLNKLDEIRIGKNKNRRTQEESFKFFEKKQKHPVYTVEIRNLSQWKAVAKYPFARYYIPVQFASKINSKGFEEKVFWVIPRVVKDNEWASYNKIIETYNIKKLVIGNLGHLSQFPSYQIHGDFGLNITNSKALEEMQKLGLNSCTVSVETNLGSINGLNPVMPTEVIVYGKIPLMVMENCVAKATQGKKCCAFDSGKITIVDRKNEKFNLIKSGLFCRNEILNSVPVFIGDKKEDLLKMNVDFQRLLFTDETFEECEHILNLYANYKSDQNLRMTRGYFYKSLE